MVLFKRNPVQIPSPKFMPVDTATPIWLIEQTMEFFLSYDEFLERMDFYNQKKFICELTGHSCLSYFEALDKEAKEIRVLVQNFPELLKKPILSLVQYSTISRLDQLVDDVYNIIRNDYFVGEYLHARIKDTRVRVVVVGKSESGDFIVEHAMNRSQTAEVPASELQRDRTVFSKLTIRTFIKHAAHREPWVGCPWVVRPEYAEKYGIPTEVPESLKAVYELRRKQFQDSPRHKHKEETPKKRKTTGPKPFAIEVLSMTGRKLTESGVRVRSQKRGEPSGPPAHPKNTDDILEHVWLMAENSNREVSKSWPHWKAQESIPESHVGKTLEVWAFINYYNELLVLSEIPYDLFLESILDTTPVLDEIFCALLALFVEPDKSELATVLPAQNEPRKRKSRARGRQVKRARNTSQQSESESEENETREGTPSERNKSEAKAETEEKQESDNETKTAQDQEEQENAEDVNDDDEEEEEEAEEEEEEEEEEGEEEGEEEEDHRRHWAEEYYSLNDELSWIERIGQRDFEKGGWQSLVICILNEVSHIREWTEDIENYLEVLAPVDSEVSTSTAEKAFKSLNVEGRILVLFIISRCLYQGAPVRQFMEKRLEELTQLRKDRAEVSREIKVVVDCLKGIRDEKTNLFETEGELYESVNKRETEARENLDQLNENMKQILNDITHSECLRMRLLGKDKFCNRYWWMEGSSVKNADEDNEFSGKPGYSMGRLWVQGPSEEDMRVFLNNKEFDDKLSEAKESTELRIYETIVQRIDVDRKRRRAQKAQQDRIRKMREEAAAKFKVDKHEGANEQGSPQNMSIQQQSMPQNEMPMQQHLMHTPQRMPMYYDAMHQVCSSPLDGNVPAYAQPPPGFYGQMPSQAPQNMSPNQMSPNQMSPNQMSPNQMSPNQPNQMPKQPFYPNMLPGMQPVPGTQQMANQQMANQPMGQQMQPQYFYHPQYGVVMMLYGMSPNGMPQYAQPGVPMPAPGMMPSAPPQFGVPVNYMMPQMYGQSMPPGPMVGQIPMMNQMPYPPQTIPQPPASSPPPASSQPNKASEKPNEVEKEPKEGPKEGPTAVSVPKDMRKILDTIPTQEGPLEPYKVRKVELSQPGEEKPVAEAQEKQEPQASEAIACQAQDPVKAEVKEPESQESDTEGMYPYPSRPVVERITAMGVKNQVEGEYAMTEPDQWRYYDTIEELDALQTYLGGAKREARLSEEISRIMESARAVFEARHSYLSKEIHNWENMLALEEFGRYHSRERPSRRRRR